MMKYGRKFNKLLINEKLWCDGIFVDPNRITTVKTRIISKGQHIARVDEETTENIELVLENRILNAIEKLLDVKKD